MRAGVGTLHFTGQATAWPDELGTVHDARTIGEVTVRQVLAALGKMSARTVAPSLLSAPTGLNVYSVGSHLFEREARQRQKDGPAVGRAGRLGEPQGVEALQLLRRRLYQRLQHRVCGRAVVA